MYTWTETLALLLLLLLSYTHSFSLAPLPNKNHNEKSRIANEEINNNASSQFKRNQNHANQKHMYRTGNLAKHKNHRRNSSMNLSSDSFSLRMASYQQDEQLKTQNHMQEEVIAAVEDEGEVGYETDQEILQRRKFLSNVVTSTMVTGMGLSSLPSTSNAYEKAYPENLDFLNSDSSINLQSIREERISVQRSMAKESKENILRNPLSFQSKKDALSSATWAGALWLLSGSRSNPLVLPIANALYDENTNKGSWVKDRNEGLFAPFPLAFSLLMGMVFLILGIVTDRTLLFLAEGQSNVVLQMAGVSLIGGASLELGRIASGEKMKTRDEDDRDEELQGEFLEFAEKRLIFGEGGSVHRSEVISAFRRFFGKYRVENDEYPLTDLEIERLLRNWNRANGNKENMTSAGFVKNLKINSQAEVR